MGNICTSGQLVLNLLVVSIGGDQQVDHTTGIFHTHVPSRQNIVHMYIKFMTGTEVLGIRSKTCTLKLLRNIYGGHSTSRVWVRYINTGLTNIGFK